MIAAARLFIALHMPPVRTTRRKAIAQKADALTHFDALGAAHMVDVSSKSATHRIAVASGEIRMKAATLDVILSGHSTKGDVLGVARIAAIQGAKRASETIPLAHPIALTRVAAEFQAVRRRSSISLKVTAETIGPTGVEMEALAGVSAGLLTIYDMCKAIDRGMVMADIQLLQKSGGRSGEYRRRISVKGPPSR
jgi:cyclic pyranopterin phosphate synthase